MARSFVGEVVVMIDGVTHRGTWRVTGDGLLIVTHGRKESSRPVAEGDDVQERAAELLSKLIGVASGSR